MNGGDLHRFLIHRDHFSEDEVRFYMAEIVIAVEQLHKLEIIHRDMKLENILIDSDGHIVIVDYGLSKLLTKESNGRSNSFYGTTEYLAPEVVRNDESGYDVNVDWWSVGVICYELLTGASPFSKDGDQSGAEGTYDRILKSYPPMSEIKHEDAVDLITKLLEKEPSKRLGM